MRCFEEIARLKINMAPQYFYCEPGWNWKPRPLPDCDLWFVSSGRGLIEVNGCQIAVQSGACFVWQPGDTPVGTQDETQPLVVFAVHFEAENAAGEVIESFRIPVPLHVRDMRCFEALAHRAEALWRRGDEAARSQSARLILELLAQLEDEAQNPQSPADRYFQELTAQIRRDPARTWHLDNMAKRVHLSRAQFTRRFRALFGVSPLEWVLQTRLERARQLLLETDMTQTQIASVLGFCDAAHFSRAFKQWDGAAPGKLRRSSF